MFTFLTDLIFKFNISQLSVSVGAVTMASALSDGIVSMVADKLRLVGYFEIRKHESH